MSLFLFLLRFWGPNVGAFSKELEKAAQESRLDPQISFKGGMIRFPNLLHIPKFVTSQMWQNGVLETDGSRSQHS